MSEISPPASEALVHPLDQLGRIDQLLLAKRYIDAGNACIAFAEYMEGGTWAGRDYGRTDDFGNPLFIYGEVAERAANQWRQVLLSGCELKQLNLVRLLQNIYQFHLILMGSYQGHMDDVIVAQHQTIGTQYAAESVLRLLLAWCPGSRAGVDVFTYYKGAPELVLAHALATVGGMALVSSSADRARNQAIDFLNQPDSITDEVLGKFELGHLVMGCWMRCSYADHPAKHQVKTLLMRLSAICLKKHEKVLPDDVTFPLAVTARGKPLLVIPLEWFTGNHAMFRCYASIIENLRESFYTVGIAASGMYDDAGRSLFDEFYSLTAFAGSNATMDMRVLAQTIKGWQPAAIYYPSVGMADWVQQLSQERLAPVQMMTLGHPATSESPEMDYVLIDQALLGDQQAAIQACFSEKIVGVEAGVAGFRLPPMANRIPPLEDLPEDGVIRIAIPSMAQKLSAGFIRCLSALEKACWGRVEFVFFLGERSLQAMACVHQLRHELGHATFHIQLEYNQYIREINRCQLHACSFPFGGTNSLVDSLRQGVPLLALEGLEPHARVDAAFIRRMGLPESLICHSEEEYRERLIGLVQNPAELLQLKHYLLHDVNMDQLLLGDGHPARYRQVMLSLLAGKAA